jgi:hypothetical protein
LRFNDGSLDGFLLRHAVGEDVSGFHLASRSPRSDDDSIPHAGVYRGVVGLEEARRVPGVEDIVITAKEGQQMLPLPEGLTYLGFLFFRGPTADEVEKGLREAHQRLQFLLPAALPVVK